MVVDPDEAVSTEQEDGDERADDPSVLDRIKSYYRKVFSPARY
ncbi:MAG: hypothetical protein ABEI57_03180 [Halapricum sp.]